QSLIVMLCSVDYRDLLSFPTRRSSDLPIHKIVGILCNSNLVTEYHPVLTPPFTEHAKRLQPDVSFKSPLLPEDPGLLFKPFILRSEEHTSELQSRENLVCRLLLDKKKK